MYDTKDQSEKGSLACKLEQSEVYVVHMDIYTVRE